MSSPSPSRSMLSSCIKVLGPFLIFFNNWGLLLSYGVFQSYYEQVLLRDSSTSAISWVGTLSVFLLLVCGSIAGPAYDQGYQRALLICGHVLTLLGVFMLSLSTELYQVFLSQGVCFGLGAGLLYTPSVAGVTLAFPKHRVLAVGIAMSGASVGGIVFSIMLEQLLFHLSFGWAIRIVGFVMIFTTIVTLLCMLPEAPPRSARRRAILDFNAFRDVPFMVFGAAGFFVLLAYYLPFIYIPTVAAQVGVGRDLQLYLLAVVNGASVFGRIVPAWATDTYGALQSLPVAQFCSAVVLLCWPAVSTVAGLIVWSCFWGFFSGMLIVMPGAAVPQFVPHLGLIGTWTGMIFTIGAFGFLVGGPIGGAIVADGSVIGMQLLAGGSMLLGCVLCATAAFLRLHKKKPTPSREDSSTMADQLVEKHSGATLATSPESN